MKKFIITILVFANFIAFTQDNSHKLDFRIGEGFSAIDLSRGYKMELCWGDGVDVPCEFTYETSGL